jgi:hypothetical protein
MNAVRVLVVLFLTVAAGCRSTPAHYYSLAPRPEFSPIRLGTPRIKVKISEIPASADRRQLVVHRGSEISILENHEWIAPLSDEIETGLSLELVRRLDVTGAAATRGYVDWIVTVKVLQLDAYPADRVCIFATWIARPEGTASVHGVTRDTRVCESIGPGIDAVVDGYRELVSDVASQIAQSISADAGDTGAANALRRKLPLG